MTRAVGVVIDGEVTWHAPGVFDDYATLCGIDAHDPAIGQQGTVEPMRGQKIECGTCKTIWTNTIALKLRGPDFR
jgi:hypothetical protein